jgi:cobyrinic acid a,c-diamide synthase
MNGFILASIDGQSGKTITTLALLTAFFRNNVHVDVFKNGPDFIDPLLHKALIQENTYNLDTWLMGEANVLKTFAENSNPEHLQIVEGNRGLFDGFNGTTDEGSTAHLARTLGLPIVLVLNASNSTNTCAAVAQSIKNYDPQIKIAGVILNFVRNDKHKKHLMAAMAKANLRVYGCIPLEENLHIDQNLDHLLRSMDFGLTRKVIEKLTETGATNFDLEGLGKLEYVNTYFASNENQLIPVEGKPVIAVARDLAFNFYYQENLDILKKLGADVIEFSPLEDQNLPSNTSAIYIGGGYCGYYGDLLEGNGPLRIELKRLAQCGLPIYAESAGVLYLSKALTQGRYRRTLAAVFDYEVTALVELVNNGYIEVETTLDNPLFPAGEKIRGVQIKIAEIIDRKKKAKNLERPFFITGSENSGLVGRVYLNTIASSAHLHFAGNTNAARQFVEAASAFKQFKIMAP